MFELILCVGIVVLVSAICSLFEAVLYAVPLSHVESMVADGQRAGKALQRLRGDVERPIAAILSLNTIANTAGAAVAGALAAGVFGQARLGYFSAFFTLLILVFSEVIPKTAGVTYSRSLASIIARPLQLLVWLFAPLIRITGLITRLVSRGQREHQVSADELLVMARVGQRTGGIASGEARVIQGILSLEEKLVSQVMTPRTVVVSLDAQLTVKQVQEQVGVPSHSRVPVYGHDSEDIVGVVHQRELLTALVEGRSEAKLESLMRPVEFVSESMPSDRLLQQLLKSRQHLAMVCDEFGGLAGVVTLEDLLEELLGAEIVDEYDQVTSMRDLARQHGKRVLDDAGETDTAL